MSATERLGEYVLLRAADPEGPRPSLASSRCSRAASAGGEAPTSAPTCFGRAPYARFERGEAHFLLEDVGPGSRRLCELGRGGRPLLALGPLGAGFPHRQRG